MFCSSSGKKDCFFLSTLLAKDKQDATHSWTLEFVYLFTYGQQKIFSIIFP